MTYPFNSPTFWYNKLDMCTAAQGWTQEDINIFMGSFPKPSVYSIISDIFISLGSHFQTFIYKFWALVMLFSCLNRERKNNVYVLHHLGTTYGRRRPSFRRLAPATITVDDGTALGLNTSKWREEKNPPLYFCYSATRTRGLLLELSLSELLCPWSGFQLQ